MKKLNMTMKEYRNHSALGASDIKQASVLAKFKASVLDKIIAEKESTAFDFGTCVHDVILEQTTERFLKGPEVSSKATKEWKDFVQLNKEKIVLSPSEHARVLGAFESFCNHDFAHKMVSMSDCEVSLFAKDTETGLSLKARQDMLAQDLSFIADLKTTASANAKDIQNSIIRYGYDVSAAHYLAVTEIATGVRPASFFWVFIEKEAPYLINVVEASPELLARGERIRRELLNKIAVAIETKEFPGYSGIAKVTVPAWADREESTIFDEVG